MSLVTLALVGAVIIGIKSAITIFGGNVSESIDRQLGYIKSAGLLALVLGVLGQMIGLYSAFAAIEQMGSVSPAMLAGGLKVSSITTLWGMVSYVISLLMYLGLSAAVKRD